MSEMTINDTATSPVSERRSLLSKLSKPLLLVTGAALIAGCTATGGTDGAPSGSSGGSAAGATTAPAAPADIAADLAAMTKKNVAKIAPTRLADGLVPPTNRWFSGLVFGDKPQPVFPMPLSASLTDEGFGLGLPEVTASEKTIMGGANPQIQVPLGAKKMQVTAYDTLSVTATYSDASGKELGSVILVQGSPFVTYTAANDQTIALEPVFKAGSVEGAYTSTVAGHEYGLVAGNGATVGDGGKVTLKSGSTMTLYGAPEGADAASLASFAADPVVSTSVDHAIDGDTAKTTLNYVTANGGDTVVSPMAGQTVDGGNAATGSYASIYGKMPLYTGKSVTTTAPVTQPSSQLDLSNLSDEDKAALVEQIRPMPPVSTSRRLPPIPTSAARCSIAPPI